MGAIQRRNAANAPGHEAVVVVFCLDLLEDRIGSGMWQIGFNQSGSVELRHESVCMVADRLCHYPIHNFSVVWTVPENNAWCEGLYAETYGYATPTPRTTPSFGVDGVRAFGYRKPSLMCGHRDIWTVRQDP